MTISSTTAGSRNLGTRPSARGATKPAATTISRFVNEISIPRPQSRSGRGRYAATCAPGTNASTIRC